MAGIGWRFDPKSQRSTQHAFEADHAHLQRVVAIDLGHDRNDRRRRKQHPFNWRTGFGELLIKLELNRGDSRLAMFAQRGRAVDRSVKLVSSASIDMGMESR